MTTKFNPRPNLDQEKQAEQFIQAAEPISHPWDAFVDPKHKDRKSFGVNLRLTETELSKLQYIKTHTNKSIQAFIMEVLLPVINEEIEKIDVKLMGGEK